MLGPARSVRAWGWDLKPDRDDDRRDAVPDRQPGPHRRGGRARRRRRRPAHHELLRRAARRRRRGSIEFHGDDASLALGSFQEFDARGRGRAVRRRRTSRSPSSGRATAAPPGRAAWPRWPARSRRAGRIGRVPSRPPTSWTSSTAPPRRWPTAADRIAIGSTFAPPPLMPWAVGARRVDGRSPPSTRRRRDATRS